MPRMAQVNRLLKETFADCSIEAAKMAISQSTLNKEQIELILSSKGLTGNILETTTAELANATATNAVAVAEGTATTATVGFGTAIKGLGASLKSLAAAHPVLLAITAAIGAIYAAVKIVDALATYLSKYRNSTISVCVKIFKKRDRNRNDFLSEEIVSLARSSNTEAERVNDEKTIIGQNTDFANLCKGQIIFFASSNLYKNKESGQYINDSKNWKEKKYKSTLVTPIQYHNNNDSNNEHNRNIKSDVIGFLCIDSQEEIKEWENSDSFELQFMAMFSDILYVYIKEFYKCFENVGYNIN